MRRIRVYRNSVPGAPRLRRAALANGTPRVIIYWIGPAVVITSPWRTS
jgi:hypothetical protein